MSLFVREQEAKLELIASIARSQQALARILGSIADISSHSELSARSLSENIRLLTQYQAAMCEMLQGITLCHPRSGTPAPPWLNASRLPHAR
ncbi:hypothetical protein VQ056_16505 [Paenibacillus sp. JTLBN-2024]|jgi:hypothetical protein|uniref:Histidine kinase n=1 Tax=Paenibacillus cookii TaxID=157839 RepID=A0ABQ4LSG8_9BACL|nr:hypothetical protein [Paenibacillus cookii]KHF32436.1 hypothetical protein CM49_05310 [Paenibacillus sp. P1XP2]GIO66206.1 hypothetical protein J21TS3_10270 [Paenibacillus cookii]